MNEYKSLLTCWHKLEHYSPASLPKGENVELLLEKEPWKIPLKSGDQNKVLECKIFLGVFDLLTVNDFVKGYFKDNQKEENFKNSKICFASLRLDEGGKYITDSFGISTLPWALSQLEKNKIANNEWEEDFAKIKDELEEHIDLKFKQTITNEENEIIEISTILNKAQLVDFQERIETLSGWSIKPAKAIFIERTEKYRSQSSKDKDSTSDILNSFYIKDLEKIISAFDLKSLPKAFRNYLDGALDHSDPHRVNVSKNLEELKDNLTPENYPDGCWPADHTLSLMQQYAVNKIFGNLSSHNKNGLLSVNGPPGTGKTMLLRDLIAPIVVKRAKGMAEIDNPANAFSKIGELKVNDKYSPWLWSPDESIINGGIVIASSNNGAVENISKELPLKSEISSQYNSQIEYFKGVAEKGISPNNWGIISAVLGNKSNRDALVSSLWFNKDVKDLQATLKENKIFDNDQWDDIRSAFNAKLKEVTNEKKRLKAFKKDCLDFENMTVVFASLINELKSIELQYISTNEKYDNQKKVVSAIDETKKEVINELSIIKSSRPNLFIYLFNKRKRQAYQKALDLALHSYNTISDSLTLENSKLSKLQAEFMKLELMFHKQKKEKQELENELQILKKTTDNARLEIKSNYADNEFWKNVESRNSQESCPWYSDKLKKLQSELFVLSLKLNEVFILTANSSSSRISTTLAAFFEYLKGGSSASKEEIKAMWNTFFLVIPVVSSTFASVQKMFNDLDKEDIPWLFIDEAGQAVPQAAAGAIWRSRRVVVVGDPFQIEPVVTIPKSITNNFSKYFELGANNVSAELSVQTMADRINPFGSYLNINGAEEWIGIPLRVHRRCINPMFKIANSIAYDNTMYCSTTYPKNVSVNFVTSFMHCKGNVKGRHFVPEQANKITEILLLEIALNKVLPDIFVITPFTEISYQLRSIYLSH